MSQKKSSALPPQLKIARTAGFCFGVKRAVKLAEEAPERYPGKTIFTLGPIIHNPQVVERLARMGIHETSSEALEDLSDGVIIIRSHGIVQKMAQKLAEHPDLTVVDATCPFVRRAQEIVAQMSDEGYDVLILGEPDHPEVAGLLSYGNPGHTRVVTAPDDLPEGLLQARKPLRLALLAQPTQTQELFDQVALKLLSLKGELRCFNTICTATSNRQAEVLELASACDCMLIIGGRNSANTNHLHELSLSRQANSHHIETAADLQPEWYAKANTIGISAGASTPQWLIDEIASKIKRGANL
jgi:4-hydroxy-3-methylbut-2-enyl diphosphate reductase